MTLACETNTDSSNNPGANNYLDSSITPASYLYAPGESEFNGICLKLKSCTLLVSCFSCVRAAVMWRQTSVRSKVVKLALT
jgi:hypothetical protein